MPDFVERVEGFSDRCLAVAEQLDAERRFARVVGQLVGSGTSVGANVAEADQAMSTADFRKCLSIAIKELAETRFWLCLCIRRNWIADVKLQPLLDELQEMRLIIGSILSKTRPEARSNLTN